ncbi:hypothetical protein GLOTRDRAFT_95746 [Gloeophyllum trabeum ATCC 11539]|uniref:F-box domain-containing protein n=1 Tax=Gloeophyllum trabeum (strain ATCC 11539 / FP-39264 / Madison 617) TaxID=670483 RepID=S7RCZ2_GLOTA|nr:uncharacterized protein GLOTRDRAFT_95746 [Gloeophyllum trabeum ATCC 11539]EPQ52070.1 hypothetical protein GLOTRDRAFT_95746 [Gloeophyllum trabeum ATCC 11539]
MTKVCGLWRSVAHSTPHLWRSICLDLKRPDFDYSQLLAAWLSRSGGLPLTIVLLSSSNKCDVALCLEVIIRFAPRWKELCLAGSTCSLGALRHLQGIRSLNTLESLDIAVLNTGHALANELKVFESAPRLSRFNLHTIGFDFTSDPDPFPWKRLTRLSVLGGATPGQCLHILQECTQLRWCELVLLPADGVLDCPAVVVPNLKVLTIRANFPDLFLECLTLPSLLSLCVRPREFGPFPQIQNTALHALVERSSCVLYDLDLDMSSIYVSDVIQTLPLMPELRCLSLSARDGSELFFSYITDELFDALAAKSNPDNCWTCLVPKLRTLNVGPCGSSVSTHAIETMLESRQVWDRSQNSARHEIPSSPTLCNVKIHRTCDDCFNAMEIWYVEEGTIRRSHVSKPRKLQTGTPFRFS